MSLFQEHFKENSKVYIRVTNRLLFVPAWIFKIVGNIARNLLPELLKRNSPTKTDLKQHFAAKIQKNDFAK